MEIVVGDISSYIKDPRSVPKAIAAVRDVCRARPAGYMFMKKYKSGMWDGYISLMHSLYKFPSGLLWLVAKRLKSDGFHITYNLQTKFLPYAELMEDCLKGIILRDYQIEAINSLLKRKRGVAKMATNSGKTEVMAGIIKSLGMPKTMVLVHRKELMYQTADRFKLRLNTENIGWIGDGQWNPQQITVAMIQSLHSKSDIAFPNNQLVMVDECHHLSSDTTLDAINRIAGAYRFGFSGTPLKYDVLADMKLMAATGRIIVDISNKYLIKEGYSATPIVYLYTIESKDGVDWERNYHEAYSDLIVGNNSRNKVIINIAKEAKGTVLILVNFLEHGKLLEQEIPGSLFVHGSDDISKRLGVLDSMRKQSNGVFIASPIFDEGIDVPGLDNVILAAGGKSHVKLLQRIGRGLRKKESSNILRVYDFIDDTNKYLLQHSEARIDTYVAEGFETILA